MCHCCVQTVPPDSSYKAFGDPVRHWEARLTAGLNRSIEASDHTLGHLEEEIARKTSWTGKPSGKGAGLSVSEKSWMKQCAPPRARAPKATAAQGLPSR